MNVTATSPQEITLELIGNGKSIKQIIATKELNGKKLKVYCGDLPAGHYELKFTTAGAQAKSISFDRVN
jgi:hypothetical protein